MSGVEQPLASLHFHPRPKWPKKNPTYGETELERERARERERWLGCCNGVGTERRCIPSLSFVHKGRRGRLGVPEAAIEVTIVRYLKTIKIPIGI